MRGKWAWSHRVGVASHGRGLSPCGAVPLLIGISWGKRRPWWRWRLRRHSPPVVASSSQTRGHSWEATKYNIYHKKGNKKSLPSLFLLTGGSPAMFIYLMSERSCTEERERETQVRTRQLCDTPVKPRVFLPLPSPTWQKQFRTTPYFFAPKSIVKLRFLFPSLPRPHVPTWLNEHFVATCEDFLCPKKYFIKMQRPFFPRRKKELSCTCRFKCLKWVWESIIINE